MKNHKIGVLHVTCWSKSKSVNYRPPHKFGSRVPSLSTEIWISRWPLWKITKLGFYTVPGGPRVKVSITHPPQFWVKGSIIVDGNRNFWSAIMKNHKIRCLHSTWWSLSKSVNYRSPTILGQGYHCCRRKSKFHLRPLWKIIKLGFACSLLVLEQKSQLPTSHKFGSRVPSLSKEIEISPLAIMKNHKNWVFTLYLVVLEQKCQLLTPYNFGSKVPSLSTEIWISRWPLWKITKLGFTLSLVVLEQNVNYWPPQFRVKGSIVVNGNQNFSLAIMKNHKIGFLHSPCWS